MVGDDNQNPVAANVEGEILVRFKCDARSILTGPRKLQKPLPPTAGYALVIWDEWMKMDLSLSRAASKN